MWKDPCRFGMASVFLVALAMTLAQCGNCPQMIQCFDPGDCEQYDWRNDACSSADGRWECRGTECVSVCTQCDSVADCTEAQWARDCAGRFACSEGACQQLCDEVLCGDLDCDPASGETRESCPADCEQPCEIPGNCLGEEWDLPCEGRWDCQDQACIEVCDYDSCGDDSCSPGEGENESTCPQDCLDGCELPPDCFEEQWDKICQGRWSCFQGACMSVCDSNGCGNGVCEGLNGENEDSCFQDCRGGPCDELIGCLGQRWYEECPGHWRCNPPSAPSQVATGACEAVCDASGCGDGACNTLGGESVQSCAVDCSGYSCTKTTDCEALTLPVGCTGWICSSLHCVPQC